MPEAANLLEKVVAKHPTDVAAQEALGAALVGRAETQTDAEKARAGTLLSARRALLHAKELGDTSDLCRILLAQIPETGESAPLAAKPEVDAALKLGEAAFAKGAWQEAIAAYTSAWDLDHNWRAASRPWTPITRCKIYSVRANGLPRRSSCSRIVSKRIDTGEMRCWRRE